MKRKSKGMTLVELIAVIAIFGVISGIIASIFSSSNSLFIRAQSQSVLQDEVRLISSAIEEDGKTGISKGVSYIGSKATFNISGTDTITYDFVSVSPEDKEVVFACRKENKDYVYVLIGDSAIKRQIKKYVCDSTTGDINEMATLGSNVKTLVIDKSSIPYKFNLVVEDDNGNEEGVESLITPRN